MLMIAALTGMVLCNRRQRRGLRYQVIALSLLVVVIISGGLFMCRIDANAMLGFQQQDNLQAEIDRKLSEAQAYVLANFIRSRHPGEAKVLLIAPESENMLNIQLDNLFMAQKNKKFVCAPLQLKKITGDTLVSPMEDHAAEAEMIDSIIAQHPDAAVVILSGISPSGESLYRLKVFALPDSRRPQIIINDLTNLNSWVAKQLQEGYIDALIVTDLAKSLNNMSSLPENIYEIFNSRYVLITRDNFRRNRHFFHD